MKRKAIEARLADELQRLAGEDRAAVLWLLRNYSALRVLCGSVRLGQEELLRLKEDARCRHERQLFVLLCAVQAFCGEEKKRAKKA